MADKKIGIVILSRFSSRRLPGKALREILGKPLLGYIVGKIQRAFPDVPVIIATSTEPSDDRIENFCKDGAVPVFRGSLENVSLRFLKAAESLNLDYAIRITGDSLFIDMKIIESLISKIDENDFDLISNRKHQMYPIGQTVEIVNVEKYREVISHFSTADDFEHVTHFLYQHEENGRFNIHHHKNPDGNYRDVSLAIDTPEDFQRASEVMQALRDSYYDCSYRDVYVLYKKLSSI